MQNMGLADEDIKAYVQCTCEKWITLIHQFWSALNNPITIIIIYQYY